MPTTITASTELELNQAIATVDGAASGAYVIQLTADIHLGTDTGQAVTYKGQTLAAPAELYAFNVAGGVSVTLDGGGHVIDGSISGTKLFRGLFVYSGNVTVDNLTVQNTLAKGGDGYNGGGGGAGLGGGLYVAADAAHGAAPAHVTLDHVIFVNNVAQGGGAIDFVNGQVAKSGAGGGLGGYVGDGTTGSFTNGAANQGGGGDGSTADGGSAVAGAGPGIILGAASAGAGFTYSGLAGYAGGLYGGGGGATQGQADNTFAGGGGGVGGQDAQGFDVGGAGGYGGGGGEAATGGFGGGGGGGVTLTGGAGGFGGGGGGSSSQGGAGGFGGGAGSSTSRIGGGGLGAGGAVFVQDGASLTIKGGSISQGGVTAGAGGGTGATSANQGGAFGAGVFLQGSATLTLAPDAGETLVISSTIADQSGVGGTGANAGSGHVVVSGAGKVTFAATNALSAPISFDGGLISNNAGAPTTLSGDYAIGSKGATVLANGFATTLSGALSGSGPLTFGPDGGGATVTLSGSDQAFTGAVIVESGLTLQATATDGLPGQSAYTVKSGGVLDLHGHAQTLGSLSDGGTTGGAVINSGGGTPTLTVGDGTSTTFSGSIGGFKQNVALVKVGAGVLTLAGDALLVGGATVSAGTLQVGAGGTHGAVTGDIADNSALIIDRSDDTTYAGAISGSGTLQKLGGGALTLTGASGFGGKTTVSQGGLYVDGSLPAAVAVATGGSLGGAGSVGAVSVANGGVLRPGSAGQVGVLHTGDLAFSPGATLAEQLNGFAPGAYDQVKVTGAVDLTGATLDLTTTNGYTAIAGDTFELIDNDGSDAVTAAFANEDAKGYVIVTPNAVQNLAYRVNTVGGDGNDVVLTFANTRPVLYNIPNSQTVASGVTLGFTGGDAFHLADADQGQTLTVTLIAQHGVLAASGSSATHAGDDTATLTLTGTASGVDALLGSVNYTAAAGYGGADTIAVSATDDSGASNDTATGSVGITVTGGTVTPPPVTPPPPAPTVAQQIASLEQGFASTVGVPVGSPKALAPPTFVDVNGNTQPDLTVAAVAKAGAIEAQLSAGTITYAQAREAIIALAGPTSAVAVEVYKFLTGVDPSAAGLAYLTNSPDNANDLTDGYYRGLNEQNRFANLATSLATEGDGRAFFMQEYAGLESFDAVARKAYGAIVGVSAAVHTGPPTTIDAAITFLDSTEAYFLALNGGSEVKARAGLIGYMLSVAWDDHLGPYYQNAHDYLGGLVPLTGSAPLADAPAL